MAHVKVVRRSMRPDEYIKMRYFQLKRRLWSDPVPIEDVRVRDARLIAGNEYEYLGDFRPLNPGDLYYTPDGTVFITADFTVPQTLSGGEVWLYCSTSSEMIVRINGEYAGGLDPNRQAVPVGRFLRGGEGRLEITGFNRSKPDDERNPEVMAKRGCRQTFEGLYLCGRRETVYQLCCDCEALVDIMESDSFDGDYRAKVTCDLGAALDLIDFDEFREEDARRARDYIEEHIYSDDSFRGSGEVYLVGHSHLDLAYYWQRKHTVDKNLRTVLIQLRLMDRFPDYRYAHTQAYTYETLEKYYPEVFAELKQRIAEGRFEPVGAMYVEPDCNLPNAESLVRQCLYGQRYFREKFGITVNSAFLPDVFGNSWILPQILRKSGVECFISNKMSTWNDTNRFPHNNFIWRGIDGTEVYACVPPTHFITWNEPSQVAENYEAYQDKLSGSSTLSMFGYGDGGSGPTEEMLELMARFRRLSVMPRTEHGTVRDFIARNFGGGQKLETWDGELYLEMHRGTFTTKHDIKRANRELEERLRCAEMLSAAAGGDTRGLTGSWKLLLINQFHDILPGSHINPVYHDAMADYAEIKTGLTFDAPDGAQAYNMLNFSREETEFLPSPSGGAVRCGVRGDYRFVRSDALSAAEILPRPEDIPFSFDGETLGSPFYTLRLNPDGSFASLFDKQLGREWVGGGMNKLRLFDDRPGNYDAWDILPDYMDRELPFTVVEAPSLTGMNAEYAEITTRLGTKYSEWVMIIRLFARSRAIEAEHRVDWHEKHKLAKVFFEPKLLTRKVVCDTSAGWIERELHRNTTWQQARFECCSHKWFDIPESGCGFAVVNDGKYGVGLHRDGVSLSLLRATERPDPVADLGRHEFVYRMIPHAGDFVFAGINRKALEFNSPYVRAAGFRAPPLWRSFAPLYLQAVKTAEDGDGTVLRLSEQDGARGAIRLPEKVTVTNMLEDELYETDVLEYSPFEIITVKTKK